MRVYGIKIKQKILIDRNHIFNQQIYEAMKQNNIFVAIGASHLSGQSGVLSFLKDKGFEIKILITNIENMQFITSKDNSRLKELRKVQQNKSYRQENNLTIIEGPHLVEAYLNEKNDFLALFCSESFNKNYPEYFKKGWEERFISCPIIFLMIYQN